jgi:hypothetical protein
MEFKSAWERLVWGGTRFFKLGILFAAPLSVIRLIESDIHLIDLSSHFVVQYFVFAVIPS